MAVQLRALILCFLILARPPVGERVFEGTSMTSEDSRAYANVTDANPFTIGIEVAGLIYATLDTATKYQKTKNKHNLVQEMPSSKEQLCQGIQLFKTGILDKALASFQAVSDVNTVNNEEIDGMIEEIREMDEELAGKLKSVGGTQAKMQAEKHTRSERDKWQTVQSNLGCGPQYMNNSTTLYNLSGTHGEEASNATTSLLEKESRDGIPALASLTLMVAEAIMDNGINWTGSVQTSFRANELQSFLDKQMCTWESNFLTLEKAHIMQLVRSTQQKFQQQYNDKLQAFLYKIKKTAGIWIDLWPAIWDLKKKLTLADVFTVMVIRRDDEYVTGNVRRWKDSEYMFRAAGDLACDPTVECLQSNSVGSALDQDQDKFESLKSQHKAYLDRCRKGSWWVLCPMVKMSPIASVIPANGHCFREVQDSKKRWYLKRRNKDSEQERIACQQEEKEWFDRLNENCRLRLGMI